MPTWLLKIVIDFAAKWLINKIGHTETAQHIESVLEKYTPPAADPNPSPAQLRKPKMDWLE